MRFLPIVTSLFFFSSRRRHTRWPRDWSSDVCSSDLGVDLEGEIPLPDLSEFQTRKEFNEWKELQSSFTNRANTEYQFVKNEYGVVASKREIYQVEQATKRAQRVADRKIQEQLIDQRFMMVNKL